MLQKGLLLSYPSTMQCYLTKVLVKLLLLPLMNLFSSKIHQVVVDSQPLFHYLHIQMPRRSHPTQVCVEEFHSIKGQRILVAVDSSSSAEVSSEDKYHPLSLTHGFKVPHHR